MSKSYENVLDSFKESVNKSADDVANLEVKEDGQIVVPESEKSEESKESEEVKEDETEEEEAPKEDQGEKETEVEEENKEDQGAKEDKVEKSAEKTCDCENKEEVEKSADEAILVDVLTTISSSYEKLMKSYDSVIKSNKELSSKVEALSEQVSKAKVEEVKEEETSKSEEETTEGEEVSKSETAPKGNAVEHVEKSEEEEVSKSEEDNKPFVASEYSSQIADFIMKSTDLGYEERMDARRLMSRAQKDMTSAQDNEEIKRMLNLN